MFTKKTATIRTGMRIIEDALVKRPTVIKTPNNRLRYAITNESTVEFCEKTPIPVSSIRDFRTAVLRMKFIALYTMIRPSKIRKTSSQIPLREFFVIVSDINVNR